jgi:hypothetical protein
MASAPKGVCTPTNKRTGRTKGFRGQKGGAHQLTWSEDPIILDRIRAGLKPWLERRAPLECLDVIHAYMAEAHPHEPEVSLRTMYDDRERAQTMTTRDLDALRAEHVAELDHVVRKAWEAFELTNQGSATRAALLGTISQAIERKAKVDGTLNARALAIGIAVGHSPDRAPRVEVDMSDDAMARILATAMDLHESHGLVIDTGTDFISPLPAPRSGPTGEPSLLDDGVDDYFERL